MRQHLVAWAPGTLLGLALMGAALPVAAQEDTPPREDSSAPAPAAAPPWRHQASLFAGIAHERVPDGSTALALHLNYERRFHAWYGIGGLVEVDGDAFRDLVIGSGLYLHPTSALRVTMLVAGELDDGDWAFLYRVGVEYTIIARPGWLLAPSVGVDFASGRQVILAGVALGRTF